MTADEKGYIFFVGVHHTNSVAIALVSITMYFDIFQFHNSEIKNKLIIPLFNSLLQT